jgi:putative PIN family toxin of toxin-antitoxin system
MASGLRVVIDTGVVVSAVLLPHSMPRTAVDRVLEAGKLLISTATVEELADVLRRPCFDSYVAQEKRLEFLAALVRDAELVEVRDVDSDCRDPSDNKSLELAVSGRAAWVITGDQDLLVLNPLRGILVVTPKTFLDRRWGDDSPGAPQQGGPR